LLLLLWWWLLLLLYWGGWIGGESGADPWWWCNIVVNANMLLFLFGWWLERQGPTAVVDPLGGKMDNAIKLSCHAIGNVIFFVYFLSIFFVILSQISYSSTF
jgi:hypothetical protein